jgi:acetyl-CoA carboxylase carboxyl transferase subunit alpha
MKLAATAGRPIVCLVDTMGADPGIGAEERGQAWAIAENLYEMSLLPVPVVVVVIGEGGSGGALAIAVGDRVYMLEYSTYSVITPEGCASILWKSAERAPDAADALRLTAPEIVELGIADGLIPEPPGGAHRDYDAAAARLAEALDEALKELAGIAPDQLVEDRRAKFEGMGVYAE